MAYEKFASYRLETVNPPTTNKDHEMDSTHISMAYVACDPEYPGAIGYINMDRLDDLNARDLRDQWIKNGYTLKLVPLAEAIKQMNLYSVSRLKP